MDFTNTFALVEKLVTVRMILFVATTKEWPIHQMDMVNAFLQDDLDEDVYMELSSSLAKQGESLVCKLKKSIYGLKHASRQWNMKLTKASITSGYKHNKLDYSLFTKIEEDDIVILLVYVDDILNF